MLGKGRCGTNKKSLAFSKVSAALAVISLFAASSVFVVEAAADQDAEVESFAKQVVDDLGNAKRSHFFALRGKRGSGGGDPVVEYVQVPSAQDSIYRPFKRAEMNHFLRGRRSSGSLNHLLRGKKDMNHLLRGRRSQDMDNSADFNRPLRADMNHFLRGKKSVEDEIDLIAIIEGLVNDGQ